MVTSLPSHYFRLTPSVSLSLSPTVPHAQYRKRFRASYNTERERKRRKWRHHCRAKIGDQFTLSLAKFRTIGNEFTIPLPKDRRFHFSLHTSRLSLLQWSPLWRWNLQWVHTFHCQKISPSLFRLSQMARAAPRVIESPRQMTKSCPVLYSLSLSVSLSLSLSLTERTSHTI